MTVFLYDLLASRLLMYLRAETGEGPGGPPYFSTKMRPEGPKKIFLDTIKTSSQNILKTFLQIPLKLHVHRGSYCRKKLPWTILEERFPMPKNTSGSKIGNDGILLLWQLRCHCNLDHDKLSSLSNTTVVAIFLNLCLWRRSLCSNLGRIDPE